MQTINLKQYYPFCKEDIFVEVSDEIVEAFLLDKRVEAARERKIFRYKAFYSLDCNDGIENAAIGWAQPSPEDHLIEKEEREKVLKEIRQLENRKKILENKQRNEERRVRTRRLIERGAILEGIFPLAPDLSGAEVKTFLIALSHLPGAAELTANLPKSGDTP